MSAHEEAWQKLSRMVTGATARLCYLAMQEGYTPGECTLVHHTGKPGCVALYCERAGGLIGEVLTIWDEEAMTATVTSQWVRPPDPRAKHEGGGL